MFQLSGSLTKEENFEGYTIYGVCSRLFYLSAIKIDPQFAVESLKRNSPARQMTNARRSIEFTDGTRRSCLLVYLVGRVKRCYPCISPIYFLSYYLIAIKRQQIDHHNTVVTLDVSHKYTQQGFYSLVRCFTCLACLDTMCSIV